MHVDFLGILSYFTPQLNMVKQRPKKLEFSSPFLELKFESRFRYPFERYACTPIFLEFHVILVVNQGCQNKGLRDALVFNFSKLKFEIEFRYPFEREE